LTVSDFGFSRGIERFVHEELGKQDNSDANSPKIRLHNPMSLEKLPNDQTKAGFKKDPFGLF
jgi:hypothetical protein